MMLSRARDGYVFLVTILVIGVVASATAASLALLGWAAEQNGYLLKQSHQAFEYANTCAERALRELRLDLNYQGSVTHTFDLGSCEIRRVMGTGNENRKLCVGGYSGDTNHRFEIDIQKLYPTVTIRSWQEVASFTFCP